jgi:hypothetical protein
METAAACTMLHSFYTEIEKILKLIALDRDKKMLSSESWHRDLLNQMAAATETRPPVISASLVTRLAELLAFRHLFRGCVDCLDAVEQDIAVDGKGRWCA